MRRGRKSPLWGLSIRQKLLLVITGLLLLSAVLSLLLHLQESRRARQEVAAAVDRIVARMHEGGLVSVDEPLSVDEPMSVGASTSGSSVQMSREILRPRFLQTADGSWTLVIEHEREDLLLLEEPFETLPAASPAVLPSPRQTVIDELRDPIEATREASLPRELTIAGAVLLVGFLLTWLIAGRLSRPLKELEAKMNAVARGDLEAVGGDLEAVGGDLEAVGGDLEAVAGSKGATGSGDEIAQMTAAFDTMVSSLREKREIEKKVVQAERLAALGDLAAGVAHDIRNPLNTIGLGLSHLRDSCAPSEADEREHFDRILDDVKAELERLNQLVHNFLSLAREDQDERAPCLLRDLVDDCLRLVRKQAESQSVGIHADLEDVGPLDLNALELRRAVTNVLLNALQSFEGDGMIDVRLQRQGATVRLTIEDHGVGMTAEELDNLFLPYFTTRSEGTGLGMPIALGIIESHGGSIAVDSASGSGTAVVIRLPVSGALAGERDFGGKREPMERASVGRGEEESR